MGHADGLHGRDSRRDRSAQRGEQGQGWCRSIPLSTALRESLVALKAWRGTDATPWRPIILKRCGGGECGGAPSIESDRYCSKALARLGPHTAPYLVPRRGELRKQVAEVAQAPS